MKKFVIYTSETVYYKTIVEAENEDQAQEHFFNYGEDINAKPYRSDFWQIDDIKEIEKESETTE